MHIVFVTTQTLTGSTMIGRVLPVAQRLAGHDVSVFKLRSAAAEPPSAIKFYDVGVEPFVRTTTGKARLRGWKLVANMLTTAIAIARRLRRIRPQVIIVVKPLPHAVLGTWLYVSLAAPLKSTRVILDSDDFELTANQLTSLTQRAVIHWSERLALRLAAVVTAATPFLVDHYRQLSADRMRVVLLPTGLTLPPRPAPRGLGPARPLITKPEPTLVYVGSISISSGHRVDILPKMLDIVRTRVPHVRLLMLGDGDDVFTLRQAFGKKGLLDAVTWQGRFDVAKLEDVIPGNAVLVDPVDTSIAQRAKSSFRVAYATATGRAVVTSNVGIRPMLLPPAFHNSFFAAPGDPADYAALASVLLTSPLADEQRNILRRHAEAFTWERLGAQFDKIVCNS